MPWVTFAHNGRVLVGEVDGERVYSAAFPGDMREIIESGITPSRGHEQFALSEVTLLPPLRPRKIIAIGRNYADHAAELGNDLPKAPLIFAKFPSSLIAHGAVITWRSSITAAVDWEGELAVVIGKGGKDIAEADAYRHVYGYTIANDVTARDLQMTIDSQWTRGKSLDTFCPLGPMLFPRHTIADPHALAISTTVNDETVQNATTAQLIFNIPQLIAYCSQMFTLESGDLLLTGTPSGVGHSRKPPRYLADGDVVSVTIEGLGTLTNPCRVLA
jgi:2-keto-4-pentenoate hydratase/2-oxohepta-3-ene-1,7-dioic acid hydratase in catechol pathway